MATTFINPFVFAGEELGGMVLLTPTSIASTGTGNSSSIGANGSVEFSSCETLSLNGVFTTDYDNYMVVFRHSSSASTALLGRLRASGTDASGTNYTRQYIWANGTSVTAARDVTETAARVGAAANVQRGGDALYVYGPFLAQPTAFRYVGVYPDTNASIFDAASTHSLSTSYDGLTVYPASGNFSGLVSVYGLVGT
jgi:hypothetical protein